MRQLATEIDQFLNEVILKSENQHEILIGHCTSEVALTNTQEHILMLLSEETLTNSELARRLNVSQAAVTKAVKSLIKEHDQLLRNITIIMNIPFPFMSNLQVNSRQMNKKLSSGF